MTLPQSPTKKLGALDTLTLYAEDFRAKLSALLELDEDSKILEELSSLKSQGSPLFSNLSICSLKMSKDYLTTTKEIPLRSSSQRWMNSGMMWNGKCLTVRISEYHKIGNVCSLSDILEDNVDEKFFLSEEMVHRLIVNSQKQIRLGISEKKGKSQSGDVVSVDSLAPTLCSTTTQKDPLKILLAGNLPGSHEQNGRVYDPEGISPTLNTMQGGGRQPKIRVREATKQGYAIDCRWCIEASVGDSVNLSHPNSKTRRGRVGDGIANTLVTGDSQGVVTPNFRIRKLTPRECWRLQGFPDWAFDKAQEVNSNSQLYKQAGNSVTVNVIKEIARYL